MISKFQIGLPSLLRQGLWNLNSKVTLCINWRKLLALIFFSAQFIKIISHYKKIGYTINVLQQTECLADNPITAGNFVFLFNCTPMCLTSDSLTVPTRRLKKFSIDEIVQAWCFGCCLVHRGLPVGFLLPWYSVLFTVESLLLLYLLFISWFICFRRWRIDKLGVVHANHNIYGS